jgi:hypothetical protein
VYCYFAHVIVLLQGGYINYCFHCCVLEVEFAPVREVLCGLRLPGGVGMNG